MNEAKVFLLELDAPTGLADSMRGILESSVNPRIQLLQGSVEIHGSPAEGKAPRDILKFNPDLIFLVLNAERLKPMDSLIRSLSAEQVKAPLIAVIDGAQQDEIIEMLKLGVVDFITPPFQPFDVLPRLWRIVLQQSRRETLTYSLKERLGLKQLVGESPLFLAEMRKIPLVAKCDSSVLITGETGTGKELFARAVHYLSPRSDKPFISVNCGAIPVDLVENELFGHTRGAYTGADSQQDGLISEAEGGTLFLDEIDCLPLASQVKLLRLLQEREYRKIGSPKSHAADVRVISATNINLEEAIEQGKFRKDLYYRVNIIPITLPPLRERKADILLLARHFLQRHCKEFSTEARDFSPEAVSKLLAYNWPGNVRELDNVVERSVVLAKQSVMSSFNVLLPETIPTPANESFQKAKAIVVQEFEKNYIRNCLVAHNGNISRAAKAAGKNRRAFWQLIRKHHITAQCGHHSQSQ